MFSAVKSKNAHLALSYSDTGIITLEQIISIGNRTFGDEYITRVLEKDYMHSTMGRSDVKQQVVKEYVLLFKKI